MKFTPTPYEVRELLDKVDEGRLALPEFQRDFIWKPAAIADFLRTVARDWPGGTFLLLEGPQEFAHKQIEGAPRLQKQPELLILDGQQRMTALYQALNDHADEVYFVDMNRVIEANQFEDEHLRYEKKAVFAKKYSSSKKMAAAGLVPVRILRDDTEFLRWTRHLDNDRQERAFDVRENLMPGFKTYFVPAIKLPRDVPISALAKIFETINRTGVRLDVFDLMVAKLYPSDFKLRDKWNAAEVDASALPAFNIHGIDVLKLIALQEHLRQKAGGETITVRGVRESDVLSVQSQTVIGQWTWAVSSYEKAVAFVKGNCGVRKPLLLPSDTMLLPLALSLGSGGSHRSGFEKDLARWFWCSVFAQTYAQGANTQAVADARALQAWRNDPSAIPSAVLEFKFDENTLSDRRRRNEILVRGIGCLLIKRNARDWLKDIELTKDDGDLDFHHIFASKYLKNIGIESGDLVANITPLLSSSNQSLRNDPPSAVVTREEIRRTAVESHSVPWGSFSEGKWNDFLKERSESLAALIAEVTTK